MSLYKEASRILKLVNDQRGSLKNLTFSSGYKNKRQLYALVCETAKNSRALQEILDATQIQTEERLIKDVYLAKALLYDLLFGKGLSGMDAVEQAVLRHSSKLKSEAKKLKNRTKDSEIEDLPNASVVLPRYVRVNTIKTTVDDVISQFLEEGFKLIETSGFNSNSYLNVLRNLKESEFAVDIDIPELLVFSPGTNFHEHEFYKSGCIILQDKASCLPAVVLNPPSGSHVIDCCAAPGNKTTFLAAMMGNEGTIYAFDKDKKRMTTMKSLSERAGASCLRLHNADFLRINPQDPQYSNVEYILVDPSCSGSGIVNRTPAFGSEPGASAARLKSLSSFQAMILKHALSFPKAKRVVYSTCSIHKEENEEVIFEMLTKYKDSYALTYILPSLNCRGDPEIFPDAVKCVSMNPESSLTNGFFISCFERINLNSKHLSGTELVNRKVSQHKKRKHSEKDVESLEENLVEISNKKDNGNRHKRQKVNCGLSQHEVSHQNLAKATKQETKKKKKKKTSVKSEIVLQKPNTGLQNDKHRKLKKRKRHVNHRPVTFVGKNHVLK